MSLCSDTRKRKEEKKAGVKATENTAMIRQTTVSPSQEHLPVPGWSNPFFELNTLLSFTGNGMHTQI